ncbi:MOSC domain-containing protein [Pseudozobellia thermophila]|uniref:MOSC domain-containing protein YiiM n=1 Tax=Pseudozobellia thermophila TaxID=192903 RepID=A0A1M6MPV4_9FLAO|nr:MOSC domain-containing protein [Pseudozobellia thermophila]SHJ85535.1 MOSC domain-containing protein YiiM [Pseudozobellia thermophila]
MHVISTNIGQAVSFTWNGKEEKTGIFKYPVPEAIQLQKEDVSQDTIIDRVHHGGTNKACYLFSSLHYPHWKKEYPDLKWDWGMFGENLTVEGLDETLVRVGNIYRIGTAMVQVTQPREPCYKLGVRFNDQGILKKFIEYGRPGTYVRILEEGWVEKGDRLELVEASGNELTVAQFYRLLYLKEKPQDILALFMENPSVPQYKKDRLRKYLRV